MKEVIVLGHGPTRVQCDYHCETWGVNNVFDFATRLDKLFIVDRITEAEFDFPKLTKVKCIVASVPYPEHPEWNIEVYPLKEILNYFKTDFFANAICFMMAYALWKGYEKIYFYGIDMMTNSTYLFEKGCVEYWMGIAHAMGVPVINTKESATGKTINGQIYGYWGNNFNFKAEYNRALAAETQRFIDNAKAGLSGAAKVSAADPDGHELLKFEAMRAVPVGHTPA